VDRIIDVFPPDQQQQVRVQLAETLQGVISQVLVPKVGGGRIAAHEIMIGTDAIRACIREGKTTQMQNVLQTGSRVGMQLLDNVLIDLIKAGKITVDDALAKSHNPDHIRRSAGERQAVGATG
jgi:twitching motility protein PilT